MPFAWPPLFQVYYWRDSSQLRWLWVNRALMSKSFPNNDPEPSGFVTDLFPYSNYKMYIVVANNRYEGPASNHIHFSTPEGGRESPSGRRDNICVLHLAQTKRGPACDFLLFRLPAVPSAPKSFRIQQRHLDSIYVDWDVPAEPNGIITGYSLKYQTGTSTSLSETLSRYQWETYELSLSEYIASCSAVSAKQKKPKKPQTTSKLE